MAKKNEIQLDEISRETGHIRLEICVLKKILKNLGQKIKKIKQNEKNLNEKYERERSKYSNKLDAIRSNLKQPLSTKAKNIEKNLAERIFQEKRHENLIKSLKLLEIEYEMLEMTYKSESEINEKSRGSLSKNEDQLTLILQKKNNLIKK